MARGANVSRSEQDQRTKSVLSFAQSIPSRIEHVPRDATFITELSSLLSSFPLTPSGALCAEFDNHGTDLWNLSTRVLQSKQQEDDERVASLLRVFACHLLSAADTGNTATSWTNGIRILKVVNRAAKTCLQQKELELGTKMLQLAAVYLEKTKSMDDTTPEDLMIRSRLEGQYSLLRILFAWHQSKPQIAESMYSRLRPDDIKGNAATSEEFADAFFEIGKIAYDQKHYETAIQWLERAIDILTEQDLARLSDDAPDLKLSSMHLLTKSLLTLSTTDSKAKATNLLELMDKEYGDKMLVSLLKLEALATEIQPDADSYSGVLSRLMRSLYLTKSNFKTILHHIHKLRKIDRLSACQCLDEFLTSRLLSAGKMEHIERAVLMKLWIITTDDMSLLANDIESFLDMVVGNITTPFSVSATFAAQTLLWKRIESYFTSKQYDTAERLAELANHRLFEKCGEGNRGKLLRKMMLCALARHDWDIARKHFFSMHETVQALPISRFLLYKVALRADDIDLATECLNVISRHSDKDISLLYACAIEAQQVGNRQLIIQTLQNVIKQYNQGSAHGVHVPALLRCLIKVLKAELTQQDKTEENLDGICRIFENAASCALRTGNTTQATKDFQKNEVDWFTKNCYNFTLEHISELHPQQLVRMAKASISFIDALIVESDASLSVDFRIRRIHCEYFTVIGHLMLARASDNIPTSHQHYLEVHSHSGSLCGHLESILSAPVAGEKYPGLKSKYFDGVKYRLEAAIRLRKWDDLDRLFDDCWRYEDDVKRWDTLADLAFLLNEESLKASSSEHQQTKILEFIKNIIIRSIAQNHEISHIARWLRSLFQLSLLPNSTLALECITHATSLAAKANANASTATDNTHNETSNQSLFPATELEWLAASAFNHAIDFYGAGDDYSCNQWASCAIQLAQQQRQSYLNALSPEDKNGYDWATATAATRRNYGTAGAAAGAGRGGGLAEMLKSRLAELLWQGSDEI